MAGTAAATAMESADGPRPGATRLGAWLARFQSLAARTPAGRPGAARGDGFRYLLEDAADPLRLYEEARRRSALMGHLVRLCERLSRPSSVSDVVAEIGHAALSLSGGHRAAVYLRWPDATVICPWEHGLSPGHIAQVLTSEVARPWLHLAQPSEPARVSPRRGRAAQASAPTLIADVRRLPEDHVLRRLGEAEGIRGLAVWPLAYEGRVTAAIACCYDAPHDWPRAEQ